MIPIGLRLSLFFRSVWHGLLGIVTELLFVAVIIFAGFVVCLFWWGVFG